jgi:regulator of sigma E protease
MLIGSLITSPWDGLLAAQGDPVSFLQGLFGNLWSIIQVLLGLGFVIFVHELGHFLAAKFFGVKCEKFYVGFDVPIRLGPIRIPGSLAKFQWGETEYGIGAIPLGGYVKMLGQEDDPRKAEQEAERIRVDNDQDPMTPPVLDPRSFPAKPVYARMVIISAGVLMNLLFGVLMAAYAFRSGVPYQPLILAGTTPGDPAWKAGIQTGDQVLQIGSIKEPEEHLQFMDLAEQVMVSGLKQPDTPYPVVVRRDGKIETFQVVGTQRHDPDRFRSMIGVRPVSLSQLDRKLPFLDPPGMGPAEESNESTLQAGDRIIAVDGQPLPSDERLGQPTEIELMRAIHAKIHQPVTLTVQRAENSRKANSPTKELSIQLPARAVRYLGIGFQVGSVSAVADRGLAHDAGVREGDRLVAFQGKPIEDATRLPLMVLDAKGTEVVLTLEREAGQKVDFRWRVPDMVQVQEIGPQLNPVGYELLGSGLTFDIKPVVSSVVAESSAMKVGLLPGDQIQQIQLLPSEKQREAMKDWFTEESFQPRAIDAMYSPIWLHELLQVVPVGTPVKVHYLRDQTVREAMVEVTEDSNWHWSSRGLNLEPASKMHTSQSWSESLSLGVKETWKRMLGVVDFLKLLTTGKVSRKAVGGPGMIFYQASSAASEGISKLLMFLTMLSANLAVLNFLPIPALDGGHMVFLLAEWIRGKPVDEQWQARLTIAGVLCLLALMAFVILNDASNLLPLLGR